MLAAVELFVFIFEMGTPGGSSLNRRPRYF